MGSSGRYGKYGEIKRLERLRGAKKRQGRNQEKIGSPRIGPGYKRDRVRRNQIRIRPARASDVGFIRRLSKKLFARYGPYEDLLPEWFETGVTFTLLAIQGKRSIGMSMLSPPAPSRLFPNVSEVLAIGVEPGKRRLGAGDLLMKGLTVKAGELGVEKLFLHTASDNAPARRLFKKHGFVSSGVKRCFYPEGQDALMMYKEIVPGPTP
jgi:ribosomal-protein-alanine N-acetyltransferase